LDKKLWRVILYAAMPLLVLNNGCARSKNQEMAQGFMAQFDRILEQRKALDKLEDQGKRTTSN
jgi:hypothetical protein